MAVNPGPDFPVGTWTDPRYGLTYKTVTINGVTWLAENYKSGYDVPPNGDEANVEAYGGLYLVDNVIFDNPPEGTHVATKDDWNKLFEYCHEVYTHDAQYNTGSYLYLFTREKFSHFQILSCIP